MIAIREIKILWSESSRLADGLTFATFRESARAICLAAAGAPQGGAYDKTKFLLTWEDGETYEGRLDLQPRHGLSDNPIGEHVRQFCTFASGRECPSHMEEARYREYLTATEAHAPGMMASCAEVLDRYALSDEVPRLRVVRADEAPVAAAPLPLNPGALTAEEWAAVDETAAEVCAREETARREKRGEGSKYQAGRPLAEIKRGIADDIKAAVRAGELPAASYKVSATRGRGSMCRPDVRVTVDGLPFATMHPDKVRVMRENDGSDNAYRGPWASEEAAKVRDKVQAIVGAYGYDRSDIQTDYFDYAFNVSIDFPAGNREWEAARAEGERLAREARAH